MILQHFKNKKPVDVHSPTQDLVAADWGLVAIEPKATYFPKDKDHLTKKYISNKTKVWEHANLILEVLDARDVQACICAAFRAECQAKNIKRITIVCKSDTVGFKNLQQSVKTLQEGGDTVVEFSTDGKKKALNLENLIKTITEVPMDNAKRCVVVGKANTGKHTLIKQLMKLAKFHNEDYASLSDVQVLEGFNIVDTPYKIEDDGVYPLFHAPSSLLEESVMAQ